VSEKYVVITDEAAGKDLRLPVIEGTEGEPTLAGDIPLNNWRDRAVFLRLPTCC